MSLRCEPLATQDIPQACELFANVFGHTTQAEHWHWKYQLGPRLASYNFVARDLHGRMVGHVGASVFPGHSQGRSLPMAQVSDVMVQADARSAFGQDQGVYPQLMKVLQKALHSRFPQVFAYGFVGIRPYKLGHRMGLYRQRQECRIGRMSQPESALELRNGFMKVQPVGWSDALASGLFEKSTAQTRAQIDSPMVERNSAYMRWRYQQHPVNTYQLWIVRQWWQDKGWLVTRQLPSGEHMLIDHWPVPEGVADQRSQSHLAALIRQLALQNPQVVLASWCLDTPQARLTEPVVATEFRVQTFQDHLPSPIFVPGDTDTY